MRFGMMKKEKRMVMQTRPVLSISDLVDRSIDDMKRLSVAMTARRTIYGGLIAAGADPFTAHRFSSQYDKRRLSEAEARKQATEGLEMILKLWSK